MLTEILDNDVIFNNQLSADSLSASGYIFGSLDIKNLNHSNAVDGQVVAWLASISSYIPVTKDTTIFADANKNIKLDNSIINGVGTYTPYAWGVYNFSIDKENEIFSEGLHHTAYITHNGELKLKGKNDYGQLGINPRDVKIFIDFQTPENAIASQKWSSVTCGNYYTLALDVDGYAWSWGLNTSGQLGKTDNEPSKINNKKWIKLLTGYGTSGGIDEDNRLFLWGKNTNILLDRDTDMHTPEGLQDVYAQYKWLDAAIGDGFIAGIDEDNNILTWGINREGQLGNGDSTGVRSVPGDIVNIDFKKWKSVKCTRKSVCALTTDGDIYTWGSGAQGCIGVGNNSNTPLPVKVSHPSNKNWINISSCNNTIAALDEDYKLFIWGYAYKRSTIESVPETKNIPNTNLKLSITEITVSQ
ncbi:MAG: RCC1 domain-containing protein, partial [Bacteroidia bacterium]